jgi:hypothetical protein
MNYYRPTQEEKLQQMIYNSKHTGILNVSCMDLTTLPTLPDTLIHLDCSFNNLTTLPTLPKTLKYLYCFYNNLTSLPTLPKSLVCLCCLNNELTTIPIIPITLVELQCQENPYNTTFANLITDNQEQNIINIRESYRPTIIKAKNTLNIQLALFKVRSCDIPDHCFSLIGSYLSGEKGSLTMQVDKLRSKLT